MKRRWIMAVIAINLAGLIALVFMLPEQMISPGPVIAAHADIGKDCFACHAPLRGAAPERCQACHAIASIGVFNTRGEAIVSPVPKVAFHQKLREQDCVACHSDHAGPKLTGHSQKPFSHSLLAAEVRAQCSSCHTKPADSFHKSVTANCSQCHRTDAWKPATFNHDKYFVLEGDHKAPCATCHVKNDLTRYTCYGCHEHTPAKIRAEHVEEGIRDFRNCVKCHRSAHGEGREGRGGNDDD